MMNQIRLNLESNYTNFFNNFVNNKILALLKPRKNFLTKFGRILIKLPLYKNRDNKNIRE